MSVYEEIENEIKTMRIAGNNNNGKKLYKPLLILSMLDYHDDKGDKTKAFNNPTHVEKLVDFFTIYLENSLIREETYSDKTNEFSRNEILKTISSMPLYHIRMTKKGNQSKFFDNNLPPGLITGADKSKKKENFAKYFEIKIPNGVDLERMCNVIRSACISRIYEETDIVIDETFIEGLNKESRKNEKGKYYRRGQHQYRRKMLEKYNHKCAFCDFNVVHTLIASHAKPWRECNNVEEKLDENNGFLLCATHDKMFDRGYLSVNAYTKRFLLSEELPEEEYDSCIQTLPEKLNIDFNQEMQNYLKYHSTIIFEKFKERQKI